MTPLDLTAMYRQGMAHQQAGRLADAVAVYRRILAVNPTVPEVLFQLGRCLSDTDRDAAEVAFRAALKGKPQEPAIWQGLHSILGGPARTRLEKDAAKAGIPIGSEAETFPIMAALSKGEADRTEAAALRLTKLAPAAFWPAFALGQVRLAMGKQAVAPLEVAHSRDPAHPGARLALARAYLTVNRPSAAEALLTGPDAASDGLTLARIYRDTARPEAAVSLLQSLKGPRALAELAIALAQTGQGSKALATATRAIDNGASPDLLRATAVAAEEAGDIAGAEAMLDAALARTQTAPLLTHRAQLDQSAGHFAQAEARLMQAIDAAPGYGEAFRAYMNGRKITADDPLLPRLDAALARPDVAAPDRAALHFAAAKARGDLGNHAAVFPHLDTANRLIANAYPYSFDADLAEARALVADWQKLKDIDARGPADKVLFVTGLPRSGTTLIETILAAHPQVAAGGEMPFLGRALSPVLEALRHGTTTTAMLADAGTRYLACARRRAGPLIPTDKAISTFSRIGHAARALPGARFVLVKRDPRDIALSLYRNMFAEGMHRYANDLTAMGRYIRLHDAITDFWCAALPDRVHVVEYEALTADPERQIRALLEAVDLPFDAACLAPEQSGRRIQTLSFAQARQPIGRSAVDGWRRYEAELAPLIAALDMTVDLAPPPASGARD